MIKSTSKFYYGTAQNVASASSTTDAMTRSDSFQYQSLDQAAMTSRTYYYGEKGDEVADYSYNYKLGTGTVIKSTSKFYYGTAQNVASASSTTDAMTRSDSFQYQSLDQAAMTSRTYYYGEKGDEVADYSYNYKLGTGTVIKSTSKFYYGTAQNVASASSTTDAMTRSDSFQYQSLDQAAMTSRTYYYGEKGDEVADYSYNYKLGTGTVIKSTSKFYYGTAQNVASASSTTDAMTRSDSFQYQSLDQAAMTSRTYYYGEKGDEVADYSYNYKLGTGTVIKSTSKFYYGTAQNVASASSTTDAMTRSDSFQYQSLDQAAMTSRTYYYGEKGDEVADYSYNYKLGTGTVIKSTSKFYYGTAQNVASASSTTDAMTRSDSFQYQSLDQAAMTSRHLLLRRKRR